MSADSPRPLPTEAARMAEVILGPRATRGRYFSQLVMVPILGGREIMLREPLLYRDDAAGFGVLIPRGFRCDGASVPRLAWWFLGASWLEWVEEGVLHDYLSRRGARVIRLSDGHTIPVTGLQAAAIFHEALEAGGAHPAAALAARGAVIAALPTYWHRRAVSPI